MYGLLTKLIVSKQLRFEEGEIDLFGEPVSFVPMSSIVYMTRDAIKKGRRAIKPIQRSTRPVKLFANVIAPCVSRVTPRLSATRSTPSSRLSREEARGERVDRRRIRILSINFYRFSDLSRPAGRKAVLNLNLVVKKLRCPDGRQGPTKGKVRCRSLGRRDIRPRIRNW